MSGFNSYLSINTGNMNSKKEMIVGGNRPISELETQFIALFPFLHLEFYDRGESIHRDSSHLELKTIARKKDLEPFVIVPVMSVQELEAAFWENMGVQVSVFRKVGNSMLETSFTSSWTLKHQNQKGSELDHDFALK